MLKINLLTIPRDAERNYRRWKSGDVCVDWLAMQLDRTVRRRLHQEFRILNRYNERVALNPCSGGQYVTLMERVDVGVKQSSFQHGESVAKKSVVKPRLVWVDGKADGARLVPDAVMVPQRPEPRSGPTHHTVNVNDRPMVPEPTPTVTGWEHGEVEHKSRAGVRRIERGKEQEAFAIPASQSN